MQLHLQASSCSRTPPIPTRLLVRSVGSFRNENGNNSFQILQAHSILILCNLASSKMGNAIDEAIRDHRFGDEIKIYVARSNLRTKNVVIRLNAIHPAGCDAIT